VRLSDEQIEVYSRQIILREVGGTGQVALGAARVRVIGTGAAPEACTSYLVGAGLGVVSVDAPLAGGAAARTLPLPAPDRRTPDAAVELAGAAASADDTPYDVLLDLDMAAGVAAATPAPRLGAIVLRADARLDLLHLLLLPAGVACVACTRVGAPPQVPHRPSAIAAASAGALAALTCCRWLLGIGFDTTARDLVLAAGSAIWTDGAAPARLRCPRGCPPPEQPV